MSREGCRTKRDVVYQYASGYRQEIRPASQRRASRSEGVKRNIGLMSVLALALVTLLGACAAPGGSAGDSASSGTSKVQAYGVIDGGVTVVK
ncbi:hypothetical protein PHO31112_05309 [Pandoraea horticolens]|uniref:Uncharacterized protein n=1 Tax=Pandoraea horticolens TaxID=2508298 RepID=A0A5E4ZCH6_9BURK|nr:hypothetical protein PHO31112_05309 [Pandoraea horticolens]